VNRSGDHHCPECRNDNLAKDPTTGETYCTECGLIINEISFFNENGISMSHSEFESHGFMSPGDRIGPSTEIAPGFRDGNGNALGSTKLLEIHRLRRTERNTRFSTTTGRNLNHMMGFMSAVASRLELTRPAREFSLHLYADLVAKRITVGRDAMALAAAAIYAGCRYYSLPYSLEDISGVVLDTANPVRAKKRVGKAYRIINREIGIRHAIPTPNDYIARFASELDLTPEVEQVARDLLTRAHESGIPGGEPASVAAALIYLASKRIGRKVTQKRITSITGVTDTTIRTRFRELKALFKDT
jgi:transcription initiation factor TFIIB